MTRPSRDREGHPREEKRGGGEGAFQRSPRGGRPWLRAGRIAAPDLALGGEPRREEEGGEGHLIVILYLPWRERGGALGPSPAREGRGAPGRATRNGGPGVSKSQDARLGDAKRGLQVRRSPGSPSQTPGKGGGTWSLRPRGLPLPLFSPLPLFKSGPGVSKSDSKRCPGDLGLGRGGTQHVSMICQPALMCTWRKAA